MHGGEALRRTLDAKLARSRTLKGWHAQLAYLTRSEAGRRSASEQFGRRNLVYWLSEQRTPVPQTQRAIRSAYEERHRTAVAKALKHVLNNDGNGTRVEVHPLRDDVHTEHLTIQNITIDDWDDVIDHWLDENQDALDDDWQEIADEKLYPPGGYYYVSHLGF